MGNAEATTRCAAARTRRPAAARRSCAIGSIRGVDRPELPVVLAFAFSCATRWCDRTIEEARAAGPTTYQVSRV
jgi:hypothetical protein